MAVFYTGMNYQKSKDDVAEYKADNEVLLSYMRSIANSFKQTSDGLKDLARSPDPSTAPESIRNSVAGLCDRRKANGVPCSSAQPSVGGSDGKEDK